MKILNVGIQGENMLAPLFERGFRELGHEVHSVNSLPLPMNAVIDTTGADLCFITHSANPFVFKGNAILAYYHSEILRNPVCMTPNYLFYGYTEAEKHLEECWPWIYMHLHGQQRLDYGIDLQRWNGWITEPKARLPGLWFTGWNNHIQKEPKWFLEKMIYRTRNHLIPELENKHLVTPIPHCDYCSYIQYLQQHEAELIVSGEHCVVSQRVFEIAAAGAIPVIWYNHRAERHAYEALGLKDGHNCLFVNSVRAIELLQFRKTIGLNAYDWVQNHTYLHRCQQVLERIAQGEQAWQDMTMSARHTEEVP